MNKLNINKNKIIGIISEFNPFHNGHKYLIETLKKNYSYEYVVCLMSPDFVERGEPSIYNKFIRSKAAIDGGADMVLELPVCYSTSSANYFATSSIMHFKKLGIKNIGLGCEHTNISDLTILAKILANESVKFKSAISKNLKLGNSYPKARYLAVKTLYPKLAKYLSDNSPNTNLALEYMIANIKLNAQMNFVLIKRVGSNYNETKINSKYPSATALRLNIINNKNSKEKYLKLNDFSVILKSKLCYLTKDELLKYFDVNEEIANLILKYRFDFKDISDLIMKIKSKNYVYSRLSRIIIHIILDIKDSDVLDPYLPRSIKYITVLSVNKESKEILNILKGLKIPVITSKKDISKLNTSALKYYNKNLNASNLYEMVYSYKYETPFNNEYKNKLV